MADSLGIFNTDKTESTIPFVAALEEYLQSQGHGTMVIHLVISPKEGS
jgi:hypothetical protein